MLFFIVFQLQAIPISSSFFPTESPVLLSTELQSQLFWFYNMSVEELDSINSAMNEVTQVKKRGNNTRPLLRCDQKHLLSLPGLNISLFPSSWLPFTANPRDASHVFQICTDQSTEYVCCLHCFRVLGYVLAHRIAFVCIFLTRRIYT